MSQRKSTGHVVSGVYEETSGGHLHVMQMRLARLLKAHCHSLT